MKVKDVMQRRVVTIDADDRLGLALQVTLWHQIRHLPVMRQGRLEGVLSERDILRGQSDPELGLSAKVKDVMRSPAEHIHPDAELADAAADMTTKKLGCLPVLLGGELVGMLALTDVLAQLAHYPVPTSEGGPRAGELMTPDPVAVSPDESLLDAAAKMTARGVRHLPVVDGERRVLGMLSERDLRTQIGNPTEAAARQDPARLSELRVSDAMTEGARAAVHDTPFTDLVNIFLVEHIGAVPVVDGGGRLEGVISYLDVLRAVAAGVG